MKSMHRRLFLFLNTLLLLSYGMHTTFCDCPLTETLDFVNLLTFSGVA